jgi:hypothetical protein
MSGSSQRNSKLQDLVGSECAIASYLSIFFRDEADASAITGRYRGYIDRWGGELRWLVEDASGKPRPFAADEANQLLERWVARGDGRLYWSSYGGDTAKSVSPWLARGELTFGEAARGRGRLLEGHVMLAWPLDAWERDWSQLAAEALAFYDTPLSFGYGGFMLCWPTVGLTTRERIRVHDAVLRRFHGVDTSDAVFHALIPPQMRTPSWLTAIGRAGMEELGPSAFEGLSEQIKVSTLSGGTTLFQLGPAPSYGDVNAQEDLPLHREMARRTRPLRIPHKHWLGNFNYKAPDWLRRFD